MSRIIFSSVKKSIFFLFVLSISACVLSCVSSKGEVSEGIAFVSGMGYGWNLGNTFDAWPNIGGRRGGLETETSWGNPRTTRKLIMYIKEQGFDTIRIPVTWGPHMGDAPEYTIDPAWMSRVEEVVDWALAEKMYVIINLHHEKSWLEKASKDYEGTMTQFRAAWRQIAARFRERTDHLIFESMNEIDFTDLPIGENGALVNRVNGEFVKLIRASGGGNKKRWLLLPGIGADLDKACDYLVLPDDPRCIVSVHYYLPPQFAIATPGTSWGYLYNWGSAADHETMKANFAKLKELYLDKGIPVIIGEYGCLLRNKDRASRADYFRSIVRLSRENGICPVFWDNGEELDRRAYVWRQEGVLPALTGN
jgi:endoglucanase